MNKIIIYIGTEAELIKTALVLEYLLESKISYAVVLSGQNNLKNSKFLKHSNIIINLHTILSDIKIRILGKYFNKCLWMIKWSIISLVRTFIIFNSMKRYKYVLVHGDTISTLIGGISAIICRKKVIHLESFLTSKKILNPFPEEICRYIVSRISHINLCTSDDSFNRAIKYNKRSSKFNLQNNTIIDYYKNIKIIENSTNEKYCLILIHRQENLITNFPIEVINLVMKKNIKMKKYFILNDTTKIYLDSHNVNFKDWEVLHKDSHFINRLDFIEFRNLLINSEFILTDSGTNQEECSYIGTPCGLLRNVTERNEGLSRNVVLLGKELSRINNFIDNYSFYRKNIIVFKESPSQIASEIIKKELNENIN